MNCIKENQNLSSKYQAETNRLIISLANLIFVDKESKDPFWCNAAKQLFIGISGIFIEDYKEGLISKNMINISSIKKFQSSSLIKENQAFLQRVLNNKNYGTLSKDYLTSILSSAENTYKSITAIFGEKMSIFDDLNVESVTSDNEFDLVRIGKEPVVLYIIVPDEDKAYFQLVTIILGMLIKVLTGYANLPQNNGVLPVKVEWICEEFTNSPPLDSIDTTVSVSRSRGMRFYYFIQSFSALEQVYGRETANIIRDNCALVYLKTNTVETAEVIAKKLGRSTVVTNSISKSTDPFKVGANKTESLMEKELLTANEIINLKYKTIIFPTFGNPVFRDTYMYSDLYPEYVNYGIYERKTKSIKRLNDNYYTVEKLREIYNKMDDKVSIDLTKKISGKYKQNTNKILKNIIANDDVIVSNKSSFLSELSSFVDTIKSILNGKVVNEFRTDDDVYIIEVSSILSRFELSKIQKTKSKNIILGIGTNNKSKRMTISCWNNNIERTL